MEPSLSAPGAGVRSDGDPTPPARDNMLHDKHLDDCFDGQSHKKWLKRDIEPHFFPYSLVADPWFLPLTFLYPNTLRRPLILVPN